MEPGQVSSLSRFSFVYATGCPGMPLQEHLAIPLSSKWAKSAIASSFFNKGRSPGRIAKSSSKTAFIPSSVLVLCPSLQFLLQTKSTLSVERACIILSLSFPTTTITLSEKDRDQLLETRKEIAWAQVLDIAIDNVDDLYTFLFTCTFEKEKYDKELEEKSKKNEFPNPINKHA